MSLRTRSLTELSTTVARPVAALVLALLLSAAGPVAQAQVADTVPPAPAPAPVAATPPVDTLGPPIAPRRAFLYSLLVPGLGQAKLDRQSVGAIFVLAEVTFIAMARKSAHDLTVARRQEGDSVIIAYENGVPVFEPAPLAERVAARRQHYEDWIALLIFNHFFAGADAFVAAHLWDVPARLSIRRDPEGVYIGARIAW